MEPDQKIKKQSSLGSNAAAQWKRAALMTRTVAAFKDTISAESDEEIDSKQQIKYGNNCEAACGLISEYCEYSSIHGFRYLGERKRPCLERLFWVLVFVVSIYTCTKLTMNIWDKWNNNPVIVSFAEKSTPVWEIPFPTVTLCPETKSRQTVFNFTDIFWKISDLATNATTEELSALENRRMDAIAQVCDSHILEGRGYGAKLTNTSDIVEVLSDLNPRFDSTYLRCKWRNMVQNCHDILHEVITEDGICYSFNTLSMSEIFRAEGLIADLIFELENRTSTDWSVEDGYNPNADPETFPKRVLGAGARAGLYLVLNGLEKDFDDLCRGPVQGFKILLHTPGEVPQMSKQYFRIPFEQEILISIKPKIITTSPGLRHYEPHRRQCFFQTERYLRYFQIYTQSNCELECLANFTYYKCGCVKFSMPRHPEVPVCGAANIKCYDDSSDELLLREFNQGIQTSGENYRGKTQCNCLPSCTSIAYEAEISQADLDVQVITVHGNGKENRAEDGESSKKSRLSIFFKEAQFLTSRRSELYGTTDFLANCGGLLGLFMGVSTLSIVELIYFCTVRLITNLKMRRKKRKELAKNASIEKDA